VVHPRLINDDLRAVAGLFAFVAANPAEARAAFRPSPWAQLTQAYADSQFRQVTRIPHRPALTGRYYVDDQALARIPAALPLLGLPRGQQMLITRGDGTQVLAGGLDDLQAMRMILLQILTGRRAGEIRTCDFDCLSAVPGTTRSTADLKQPIRCRPPSIRRPPRASRPRPRPGGGLRPALTPTAHRARNIGSCRPDARNRPALNQPNRTGRDSF
jgi:hypothetical protein